MADEEQGRRGILVRGADGFLYFVPSDRLGEFRVAHEKEITRVEEIFAGLKKGNLDCQDFQVTRGLTGPDDGLKVFASETKHSEEPGQETGGDEAPGEQTGGEEKPGEETLGEETDGDDSNRPDLPDPETDGDPGGP